MKQLNENFTKAYQESLQSIKKEERTFRLCRFYQIEKLTDNISNNAYRISSSLLSIKVKNKTLSQDEMYNFFKNLKEDAVLYGTDAEDFIDKKLTSNSKSVFLFKSVSDKIEHLSKPSSKPIVATNDHEQISFDTVAEAAVNLGLSPKSTKGIYNAIKSGKQYKGFAWTRK